jgi:hypothetical protein
MRAWIFAAAAIAMGCGEEGPPADHLPDGPGRWETAAPALTPRSEAGVGVARGLMVTAGGFHDAIEVYDPVADVWRAAGTFTAAIDHVGAAGLPGGEQVLIAGFYAAGAGARAETFAFDPEGDRLIPRAALPKAIAAGALVQLDENRMALVGGNDGGRSLADLHIYDVATDSWSTGPSMSVPRDHLGAAVVNGKLYAIGGRNADSFILATVEIYDLAANTWSRGPDLQVARSGHAVAAANGKIYAFGGEGAPYPKGTFPEVEEFDPATNAWKFVAPMPTPRHGIQAATFGDRIHVPLGGDVQGSGTLPTHEVFTAP